MRGSNFKAGLFAVFAACAMVLVSIGGCVGDKKTSDIGDAASELDGLTFKGTSLVIDGKETFTISLEIQYYHVFPSLWEEMVEKAKANGVTCISTYVPWGWHETSEGVFDFDGNSHPQRDVKRFVQIVQDAGLYLIVRPGPFICAEIDGGGVPAWFMQAYPEVTMKQATGLDYNYCRGSLDPLPNWLHPKYLEGVRSWYGRVCEEVFTPNLVTKGGCIIAVQIDNEFPYSDYTVCNPYTWGYDEFFNGKDGGKGYFQNWLESYYGTVEEYNRLHNIQISSFSEVSGPTDFAVANLKDWMNYQDWVMAKEQFGYDFFATYAQILKDFGIDVPIYHDALSISNISPVNYHKMAESVWVCPNMYIDGDPATDMNIYAKASLRCKYILGVQPDKPLFSPETSGAGFNERLYLAQGMNGWNIYSPEYYGDPLYMEPTYSLPGTLNDLIYDNSVTDPLLDALYYNETAILSSLVEAAGNPAVHRAINFFSNSGACSSSPVGDLTIGYYPPGNYMNCYMEYASIYGTLGFWFYWPVLIQNVMPVDGAQLYNALKDYSDNDGASMNLIKTLTGKDVDYLMLDIQAATLEELLERPILTAFGFDMMDADTQSKLVSYVEQGGVLIMMPRTPYMDLKTGQCTILRDTLFEADVTEGVVAAGAQMTWENGMKLECNTTLDTYSLAGLDGYESLATASDGKTCAYSHEYGDGTAILIGSQVYNVDSNGALFEQLVSGFGQRSCYAISDVEGVDALARIYGNEYALCGVVNRGTSTHSTISVYDPSIGEYVEAYLSTPSPSVNFVKIAGGELEAASIEGGADVPIVKCAGRELMMMPTTYNFLPGTAFFVNIDIKNGGNKAMTNVSSFLILPDGWTYEPMSLTQFSAVEPGESARFSYKITPGAPSSTTATIACEIIHESGAFDLAMNLNVATP